MELTRRQVYYLNILSEFHFKIIFRPGTKNAKADALTRLPGSTPEDSLDERSQQQLQTILTPDRVEIRVGETNDWFNQVLESNKTDEACEEIRQSFRDGTLYQRGLNMDQCRIVDGVLYKGDLLWVPEDLRTDLLKEIYN